MDLTGPIYAVPKRYHNLFAKGEVVHEIRYAQLSKRWVVRQLFPWLSKPFRSLDKIQQDFGDVDKFVIEKFLIKIPDDSKKYSFYFRSAKQIAWVNDEDKYLHELIAVHDGSSFLTERNFYRWWETFNLPPIYEIEESSEVQRFTEEFNPDSHGVYIVDSSKLMLYYSMNQVLKSHGKEDPFFLSSTLGILLHSLQNVNEFESLRISA